MADTYSPVFDDLLKKRSLPEESVKTIEMISDTAIKKVENE